MSDLISQREFARDVVTQLRDAGYQALWAGGCVRDQLLQRDPKDYDVATSALPDQVRGLFGRRRTIPVGAAFGVIMVLGPRDCPPIEVATFRTDGQYSDGRRPDSVVFCDAQHDAQRRDFTINGLFYDPLGEQVVDYVGGRADIAARRVRAIGDPRHRFAEDKLRMLRAIRFAACLEFALDPATMEAVQEMAPLIQDVSAERTGAELRRMLTHPSRGRAAALLAASGLLRQVLPELAPSADQHDATWQALLTRSVKLTEGQAAEGLEEASLSVGLAAWLVDVCDATQVREVARRLRYTTKEGERAAWLVAALPRVAEADRLSWPVRQRLLIHDGIGELLALATAQWGDAHPGVNICRQELAMPPERLNPPPLANGDDLLHAGLRSGKHFAALLDHLRDLQLEGKIATREEAIAAAVAEVARSRDG